MKESEQAQMQEIEAVALRQSAELESRKEEARQAKQAKQQHGQQKQTGSSSRTSRHKKK